MTPSPNLLLFVSKPGITYGATSPIAKWTVEAEVGTSNSNFVPMLVKEDTGIQDCGATTRLVVYNGWADPLTPTASRVMEVPNTASPVMAVSVGTTTKVKFAKSFASPLYHAYGIFAPLKTLSEW